MSTATTRKYVAAPPERCFERATDLRRAPETIRAITAMEVLTDGPIGVGTRFRETRVLFERACSEEMEITSFDPPRGYVVRAESHGCRYRTEFRFTPRGSGTELEMIFEARPLTAAAKVMSFLMKPMLGKVMAEAAKDLDDLAAAIEGGGG